VYDGIAEGAINLVIGTQALIRQELVFHRLGLVIIDEQHRFGVRQRSLLDTKGDSPHLLVMTATPIPRTLAMTLYADLTVTALREHPRGRPPVITRLMERGEKRAVLETMLRTLSRGQQALVVCPVIEASEEADLKSAVQMHESLKKLLGPKTRVGLVHGRLPLQEKEQVLDAFRRRETGVLVGTTVIEVGIHAPGAAMMVIEHPERFGLAQLHQMRGRVGRGSDGGICFLMISEGVPEQTLARLRFLEKSQDGFEIARKDLETRGQGELTGFRQAGPGELDFQEVMREPELLMEAKRAAEDILRADPGLAEPGHRLLMEMIGLTDPDHPDG
jgi:ATP-dependent DNA helicase RecG